MQVIVAGAKDSDRWQSFVNQHQMCFNYHRWPWKHVIESAFQWRSFYLMAEKNGCSSGNSAAVLAQEPAFWKCPLFCAILQPSWTCGGRQRKLGTRSLQRQPASLAN